MKFKNWQLIKLTIDPKGKPIAEIFIRCIVCEKGLVLKEISRREKNLESIPGIYFCNCLPKKQLLKDIRNSTFIKELSTL